MAGHLGGRTTRLWLGSQTRLRQCWRTKRAEGKYSSLRKLKPEPASPDLVVVLAWELKRKDKPNGVVFARVLMA